MICKGYSKKKMPLQWSMMGILGLVWLLPLLLIGFGLLYFVSNMIGRQVEKAIGISTEKAVEICEMHLEEILTASKTASYYSVIQDSYNNYRKNGRRMNLYRDTSGFLEQQFKYNRNMLCTMVFFMEDPEHIYYTYNTYQNNNTGMSGYDRVLYFQQSVMSQVTALSEELDTRHALYLEEGHLYMVRNLVGTDFKVYGMIIIELSPQWIFESLDSVWGSLEHEIFLNGSPVLGMEDIQMDLEEIRSTGSGYIDDRRGTYSYLVSENGQQELIYLVRLDPDMLIDDVSMLRSVLILVIAFTVPLIFLIFWFFHTKVSKPVAGLVKASGEITAGKYGHVIEQTNSSSREFDYLNNAFNAMSIELKYQFERIYLEELARKDASIKALQSQINPHFLNNTLEIINWEARMNEDEGVCRMIEALATMLNATMNREQKRYITLTEELEYVDAYLYIIQQRLGERFRVEREIDEGLLSIEVPLLIIQPIVENAVKHGMNGKKSGSVRLRIYRREDMLYIEVQNEGELSREDKEKIAYLLGTKELQKEELHISLGIRNVDRRLKIIYGEECGLSIEDNGLGQTVSTLKVKIKE